MRAVILWGWRLVEGPRRRSEIEKWSEIIGEMSVGERVASVLLSSWRFDRISYCGRPLEGLDGVEYLECSSEKHFFKTLDIGMESESDTGRVAVFASDLPLLTVDWINALLDGDKGRSWLHLPYVTNAEIQTAYPGYNPEKRFASFAEGEIVFSNAFIVNKRTWAKTSKILQTLAPKGRLSAFWCAGILFRLSPSLLLRALVHSNSKLSDSSPFLRALKRGLSKPSLHDDVIPAISRILKEEVTASPSLPQFSVDFDRRSHQAYFESALSRNHNDSFHHA